MALDVEQVMALARDGVLVLRPLHSKVFRQYLLLICAVGAVLAGWGNIARGGDSVLTGVLLIVIAGLCVTTFILRVRPGMLDLRLDIVGFAYPALWRRRFVRWADVREISVTRTGPKLVGWHFLPEARPRGLLARLGAALGESDGALPHTHGLKPEDLALLMENWRAACTESAPPADGEAGPGPDGKDVSPPTDQERGER